MDAVLPEEVDPATLIQTSLEEPVNEESNEANANTEEVDAKEDIEESAEPQEDVMEEGVSIQIAPTENASLGNESDPMLFVQLGDRIIIDSTKYGRTTGTVYYRSLELISVIPDGVSNTLHRFELEQTDDEELYKEEDGVSAVYVIEKRQFESFVEQQNFRVNQIIDTFTLDGTSGQSYKIIEVDEENDSIVIQDLDDPENDIPITFNFTGIDPDVEFSIISIRQFVGTDQEATIENHTEEVAEVPEEEEVEEEEDAIEEVGYIEVMRPKIYKEAASYEQRIPDNLQKIDALNDFISGLDSVLQKDLNALRSIRILVETLFNLKQSTIQYNDDGSIRGPKNISATTLAELIQISKNIPLGRPVLTVSKKEYSAEEELEEKKSEDGVFFANFEEELLQMIQNQGKTVSSNVKGGTIIREWNDQQAFLKQYMSPWTPDGVGEPMWKAGVDSEFFRTSAPVTIEQENGTHRVLPVIPGYIASRDMEIPPIFDEVSFGLERALSTTYRKSKERRKDVLINEDAALMDSYILFPMKTAKYIGTTRSYNLAIDSGRSQLPPKTMMSILQEIGAPKEMGATSNDAILLNVSGNTLGNIPLVDYIDGVSIPSLGLGDTFTILKQYGIDNIELNADIVGVLQKKIELYQAQLITALASLRNIIESTPKREPEQNPFLDNPAIIEQIRTQPILLESISEYERTNPTFAQSDIGIINHLIQKYDNYFQVAAGKNPVLIAKAILDANNTEYLKQLKIANTIKYNQLYSGTKPKKNMCKHVSTLVSIRKIRDDADRFHELAKFFKIYQGPRNENWIDCNTCKEHLLCVHERLQLQAYLRPKEKDTIEKEIILSFSGGQFQGKYICRNCGQAMHDMDFDNNIEFDDNGKPKSGRAVLVDEDAIFEDKVDELVSVPIEDSQKKELKLDEDEIKAYNIIRELSERIGIQLDNDGYRNCISRVLTWINTFPSRETYVAMQKQRPKMPDYDIAMSNNIISACAVFLLIEIQCKKPAYVVRYALVGCVNPGFGGFPLVEDDSNKQGIEYIACAVSSIRRNEPPWNQSEFHKIADDTKRMQMIMKYMLSIFKQIIGDDIIQSRLSEKRKYLSDVLGTASDSHGISQKDMIYSSFLPEQIVLKPEDAAMDVITPEVAATMGNKGKIALVKLWIRQAHMHAKTNAILLRGSPLIETSCCMDKIDSPSAFWNNKDNLPDITKRSLQPKQQGQALMTEFVPRDVGLDVVEPNKDLYYRIFLKYCFQGERMGYTHEPGVTNKCISCGFQFPSHPSIMNSDTEGKAALSSQEVKTGSAEFIELLDKIHTVYGVTPLNPLTVSPIDKIMNEFGSIVPSPLSNWKEIIDATTLGFQRLAPDADISDITLAASSISEASGTSEQLIKGILKPEQYHNIMDSISNLSWLNFFQVIQIYFITPFQRLLTQFSRKSLFIPMELVKELSESHAKLDLEPILDNELEIIKSNEDAIKMPTMQLARAKIEFYLKQMSTLLPFKSKIRQTVVPGGSRSLKYIQRALFYGPLSTLMNSTEIPEGTVLPAAPIKSVGNTSMKFIAQLVVLSLNKYSRESLSYNDSELKNLIAIRDEKERVNVVKEFNKLTDEERGIELMNKKLGLGKWAVGGTKLIYAYDKDYYDLERQKRLNAGIMDFPGLGDADVPQGRDIDPFGFPTHDVEEGGYDNNQHADDDNE